MIELLEERAGIIQGIGEDGFVGREFLEAFVNGLGGLEVSGPGGSMDDEDLHKALLRIFSFPKLGKFGMITVDDGNGFQEIGGDKIRTRRPGAHVPAVFAPGEDKDGFAPGLVPGEDVGLRVADEERLLRRVDALVHRFKGLAHRSYFRLAAVASFIRAMRAIKNFLDPAPACLILSSILRVMWLSFSFV